MIEKNSKEKILLALLPFWDPQIPPLGLGCLKSYLKMHGYEVKTVDANLDVEFREILDSYYAILKTIIPVNCREIFSISETRYFGTIPWLISIAKRPTGGSTWSW
jgi:hypothetical protein